MFIKVFEMVINEKQDLTYLKWSHIRGSSGTAGTFLKSSSELGRIKKYYKLSNFDPGLGVVGHECVNEIIADRLLTILGVEHLGYDLINADIEINGQIYNTYLCSSVDFKLRGDNKIALDDYFRTESELGESPYDFCIRKGFSEYIDRMLAFDFIILNRDRHGANIEVLRNSREHTVRLAPLFDHGLSLLCSCTSDDEVVSFDVMADRKCGNFIGGSSSLENLSLIKDKSRVFSGKLKKSDRKLLFKDLDGIISEVLCDRIWEMIWSRYKVYEDL